MDDQAWNEDSVDKEIDKQSKWSEHCKTFLVKDAHGTIKELVFPKALDLDRPKRERTIFSNRQLSSLEEAFRQNQYLVGKDRTIVAKRLGLSETQVKVWFQNRRTKHKKDNDRSGGSKDLQAESKAAQNVLKLLEYKTALSYNKFLNSPSTNYDRYSITQANNIGSPKCQTSDECTDHIGSIIENTVVDGESSVGRSARKGEGNDIESSLEKAAIAVIKHPCFPENDLPWEKDFNSSNKLHQNNLVSNSEALIRPPSETVTNLSRQEYSALSPVEAFKTSWNSSIPEKTHSKLSQLLKSVRPHVESLLYSESSFRHSISVETGLSHSGDQLQQRQPVITSDCQIPKQESNSRNEQTQTCVTNKETEHAPTPQFCTINPFPGPTYFTAEATRDYYRIQGPDNQEENSSSTFPSVYTDTHSANKCARNYFDKISSQNKIPSACNPTPSENDVVANVFPQKTFPNFLHYQGNMSNMAYQHPAITPVHRQHQQDYASYRNIKHLNYYAPNIHSLSANEPTKALEALQYMPVYHTYRDVYAQASNCVHNLGTSQSSLLSHPSVMALSTQYHVYPRSTTWNQSLPECYQTN